VPARRPAPWVWSWFVGPAGAGQVLTPPASLACQLGPKATDYVIQFPAHGPRRAPETNQDERRARRAMSGNSGFT
jgi:hypothetical protein